MKKQLGTKGKGARAAKAVKRVFYDWNAKTQRMVRRERFQTAAEARLERKAEALKASVDFREQSAYGRRVMLLRRVKSDEVRELLAGYEARIAALEEALVRTVEVLSAVRAGVSRDRR